MRYVLSYVLSDVLSQVTKSKDYLLVLSARGGGSLSLQVFLINLPKGLISCHGNTVN